MTFSMLTVLVVIETFIILLVLIAYFINKNSKLKKSIDELLTKLAESLFSKLINEEIDKTIERVQEIDPIDEERTNLSDNDIPSNDDILKKALTFRSSYLHAEINAYESSEGDPGLFWHYLADNITPLIKGSEADTPLEADKPESNDFINEIMQEMQNKLDKSIESNLSLQAILDSLVANGALAVDQIQTIKNYQVDFQDLNQNISDLENKIKNSLSLEITSATDTTNNTSLSESVLDLEKTHDSVNVEVNKLKDVIYEQGNKINALLKSLKDQNHDISPDSSLSLQLKQLETSQNETAMCMEVLEMENHRLIEEIKIINDKSKQPSTEGLAADDTDKEQLNIKIGALENIIIEKDKAYQTLKAELESVEREFMAVYEKNNKED